jgi:Mce-associated membrane protein
MTKPHSGGADEESDQPEGESAAVRVQTDAASEQDTAAVQTAEPVEGEANEPEDAENTVGAEDTGQAEAAISDEADAEDEAQEGKPAKAKLRISWPRVLAYGLLPGLALVLAAAGGFLKWQDSSARAAQLARIESVAAAKDSTIALLSYRSDTVEKDLEAAKNRMTGAFKESYSQLINDVVIPGAKKGHISTTATVPAAASVSATPNHAVTLLFVNQTAVVDKDPPADTVSSVRVTLDKVDGRWLISGFDPV